MSAGRFGMSAECPNFKRKFPYNIPENTNSPLSVQQVGDRFIYHLVTKKRFFQKPTYECLRQSLEAMTNHANKLNFTRIRMPKAGCELDRLEWLKVERLIMEKCAQSNLTITVYDQSKDEKSQNQTETPVRSALGQAQRQYEALSKLIHWIEKETCPHHKNYNDSRGSHGNSTTISIVYNSSMEFCAETSKLQITKWFYKK